MIRILLSLLAILASLLPVMAQTPNDGDRLWFSVAVEPDFVLDKGAYVDGEMVLRIRLMSPDPFQRLRLDLPDIEGARVETLVRPHMRQLGSLGAMGYADTAGYSYEARLAILPQRSGALVIPPISVTGLSQTEGGPAVAFRRTVPERSITVHPPSPDFAGEHWIVSREARLEEQWSPEIEAIRDGDTVHRRVALTVAGVIAEDLPTLTLEAKDGYRVLSTLVQAETEVTEDGLIAHLEQSWDIYVETADVFHVDGFRFPYWNPETARTEIASLPSQRVEPLPEDATALRDQLRADAIAGHRARSAGLIVLLSLPLAALLALAAFLLWRTLPTRADIALWRAARRAAHRDEEAPMSFYPAFLAWSRRTLDARPVVSRQQLALLGDRAADHVDALHRSIFASPGGEIPTRPIARALIGASRRMTVRRLLSAIRSRLARFLMPP